MTRVRPVTHQPTVPGVVVRGTKTVVGDLTETPAVAHSTPPGPRRPTPTARGKRHDRTPRRRAPGGTSTTYPVRHHPPGTPPVRFPAPLPEVSGDTEADSDGVAPGPRALGSVCPTRP